VIRFSLLLLLLLASSLPAPADDASPMRSIFLIARKDLPDPFFRDSVVLVTHRGDAAPVGVIINKPTPVALGRKIPDLESSAAREEKVFLGGPVNLDGLVVVFRAASSPRDSIEVLDGVYLSSSREVLQELLGRDNPVKGMRVYAGYAAWAPGQLEAEIARGDWHLARADAGAIFDKNPQDLWKELEKRAAAKPVKAPCNAL
jgi:putative transcriptional regulator